MRVVGCKNLTAPQAEDPAAAAAAFEQLLIDTVTGRWLTQLEDTAEGLS